MLRCVVCRTRRASFAALLAHRKSSGHAQPCNCGGYHHPHRPGSPCCDANPYPTMHRARRAGASDEDVLEAFIDDALFGQHKPLTQKEAERIPF